MKTVGQRTWHVYSLSSPRHFQNRIGLNSLEQNLLGSQKTFVLGIKVIFLLRGQWIWGEEVCGDEELRNAV